LGPQGATSPTVRLRPALQLQLSLQRAQAFRLPLHRAAAQQNEEAEIVTEQRDGALCRLDH